MASTKLSLAQATPKEEEIKKTVTKKLYGKQKPEKSLHDDLFPSFFSAIFDGFTSVFMIFPAVLVGIMCGIGAAFKIGIKQALKTYDGR